MVDDKEIEEFIEKYGDVLPDPEQYPKVVVYYIKLYKWEKEQQKNKMIENNE
jgi:hypothetical protein|tara:strand:- start:1011 stop:1166 length:156 start_codon:yes stop_codon:yes gene_type:complete